MSRLPRLCPPGIPQHIIQRGTNRQACFASDEDFAAYAHWLGEHAKKNGVAIHAWVFMTNHVHLLVTPNKFNSVSRMMQSLGRQYVRYFNYTYQRTGTLWEGRFKSCVVDAENYFLLCQRYIELNPVRAGMVEAPGEYRWSSFKTNGLGHASNLWTPHDVYNQLGKNAKEREAAYKTMFEDHIDKDLLQDIRDSCNKGLALGSDRFKQEIEGLTGRRVTGKKRGPKSKMIGL
ncbi:MAG: transposase [Hahellaceae bacterium]|nr:transposase [Hahellaceae bacterium]